MHVEKNRDELEDLDLNRLGSARTSLNPYPFKLPPTSGEVVPLHYTAKHTPDPRQWQSRQKAQQPQDPSGSPRPSARWECKNKMADPPSLPPSKPMTHPKRKHSVKGILGSVVLPGQEGAPRATE